jgi:luciferase family oxidoreductase group 1
MAPLSVLDLAFVPEGATAADALACSLDLARHAERLGYRRFWLAEHHNMIGIASAATSVVQDVLELQALLGPEQPGQTVQAVPGTDTNVPLWILGSSLFGAQLAAALGLPYAFASHFAPDALHPALAIYREKFKSSAQLDRPHAMVGVNVVAADTDAAARRLFTSVQQSFVNMVRGTRGKLPPPIDDIETFWTPMEKAQASGMLSCSVVGSPETVRRGIRQLVEATGTDELIVAAAIHDHEARLRSYEILVEAVGMTA